LGFFCAERHDADVDPHNDASIAGGELCLARQQPPRGQDLLGPPTCCHRRRPGGRFSCTQQLQPAATAVNMLIIHQPRDNPLPIILLAGMKHRLPRPLFLT
jgi:hypothetical protein